MLSRCSLASADVRERPILPADPCRREPELLAPAGTWEALEAVVEAGADAVYLGGKRFNMRLHRAHFNFTQEGVRAAVRLTHSRGAKLYAVVNNLMKEGELQELEGYLAFLEHAGVDALIVQDLGTIELCRSLGLSLPLHGSTQLDAHSSLTVRSLSEIGVSRVILSRDLRLEEVQEIRRNTGMAVECFIHGELCISHSGQCYLSGMITGKSANRGQCLKPCRWAYEMVDRSAGHPLPIEAEGPYLLAARDLCLYRQLPELLRAGITAFKIEGRMRPPEHLFRIVRAYRQAIDRFLADPRGYATDEATWRDLEAHRIRNFTTGLLFKDPGLGYLDPSGRREPAFLSRAEPERSEEEPDDGPHDLWEATGERPHLAVKVGSLAGATQALAQGADRIYLASELIWSKKDRHAAIERAAEAAREVVICLPRILRDRECTDWERTLRQMTRMKPPGVLVSSLGALALVRRATDFPVYTDFPFNVLNSRAVGLLAERGAFQVTLSLEASFEDLDLLAQNASLPLEAVVHGPLPAMVLEHCLPGMLLARSTAQDPCPAPCHRRRYGLKDELGQERAIEVDGRCVNLLYLARELACLFHLHRFRRPAVRSLRIEAQFYPAERVGTVTRLYRRALAGERIARADLGWQALVDAAPQGFTLGAYKQQCKMKNAK